MRPAASTKVELFRVVFFAETPIGSFGRELVLEKSVEIAHRRQSFRGRCGVRCLLRCGRGVTQCLVDQRDIAVVLFTRDPVPYFGRVGQIGFGLLVQGRHFLQTMRDVIEALLDGRVVEHVRREQGAADELDVYRGIVLETLDSAEFEQTQAGVALDDVEVGLLFLVQFGGIQGVGTVLYAFAKAALLFEACGAVVIEKIVEPVPSC